MSFELVKNALYILTALATNFAEFIEIAIRDFEIGRLTRLFQKQRAAGSGDGEVTPTSKARLRSPIRYPGNSTGSDYRGCLVKHKVNGPGIPLD